MSPQIPMASIEEEPITEQSATSADPQSATKFKSSAELNEFDNQVNQLLKDENWDAIRTEKYFEMKTVAQALKQANYKKLFSNIAELHDQVQMLAAENEQMICATADMALQIAEANTANQL
ncbi:hypothetical protein AJ79_10325 [Helicocarpus griseus UAMH5409]|uniref:Uncharacterized protein n=1 Tax=Helicocarpus griseus UAMH5409 TaxID=1447875 RepID=A0A2B7WEM1_9EURO|nr:hypothetical protein AJ79_10325 [Helicocarpus griseus UAMH5409]